MSQLRLLNDISGLFENETHRLDEKAKKMFQEDIFYAEFIKS